MIETFAAIFGLSADDFVKVLGAIGMLIATVIGAVARLLKNLRGGSKRLFVKIRRMEDLAELIATNPDDPRIRALISEIKADQRDESDSKDSETS